MRLEPVEDWITAIAMVYTRRSPIVAPDPSSKTTRCYYIESVGPKAAEAGFSRGDVVVAKSVFDLLFRNGAFHRVTFIASEVIQRVHDVPLEEFTLLDGKTTADQIAAQAAE